MKVIRCFWLLPLVLFLTSCPDDPVVHFFNDKEEFDAYLEDQMDEQEIPALSVVVFEGETILHEKYLGQSDLDNNLALNGDDIFMLASVSKMVTATALMQLFDIGEFGLDDPINDYLPFQVSVPNQSTPITFRMLLTHTSGIDDGEAAELFYSYGQDSPLALKTYMEEYLVSGGLYYDASDNFHDHEPGTAHFYSNMASAFIGVLVEEIAGQNFNDYCKENIFQPLGMTNTYWSLNEALQSNKTLVQPSEYVNGQLDTIQHYTFPDYPNGALRSTARDMVKFLATFTQEGTSNGHQLLKPSTVNEMLSLQIPNLDNTMGLHVFLLDATSNIWGHNGSEQGVSTEVGFNPTTKTGAIVLSNDQEVEVSEILVRAYELGLEL